MHWIGVLSWQDEKHGFFLQLQGVVATTLQVP
jgi:hypothetical protein